MKSTLTFCIAAAALTGCANLQYWDHGEWLDRVSVRPAKVAPHSPEELQALSTEAAQLHARAETIRVQLASEKSRDRRIQQLKALEEIGDELRPVERALQGGPMPYRGHPLPEPGNPGA